MPTSRDSVPGNINKKHGCINADEINFNCYYFEVNKIITTNDWGFELPTFMYGYHIDTYDLNILKDVYRVEGTEYEIIGTLKQEEYKNIIKCFAASKSVKNKYRRIFKTLID